MCKGKLLMSEFRRRGVSTSLLSAVIVLTGLASGSAFATDLIILRDVPPHSAVEPTPLGAAVSVQVEQSDLIHQLLSGPKPLGDDEFGAVLASPPQGRIGGMTIEGDTQNAIDGSRGDALSNVPGGGMGSFSSLNGIGGEISGQVNSAVTTGLQGLSSALGAAAGASQ